MDYRDVLVDGLDQLNDWLADAIREVSEEQMNWLPPGKALSIGFNAWHIVRTHDNIVNFVFQRKQPIWVDRGYFERFHLPKVDQGTGMGFDDARALRISDAALLREYAAEVAKRPVCDFCPTMRCLTESKRRPTFSVSFFRRHESCAKRPKLRSRFSCTSSGVLSAVTCSGAPLL